MATQTFTLEGQSYTVPHGTSMDELDEYIKGQKKGSSPEEAAAANPPKAAPGPPMKQWSATGPDVTPLTQKQSDTAHTGAPSGVLGGMAGLAPVGIAEKGFAGYVAPLARNVAKSYLVSKGGEAVGRHFGGETGAEIGKWGGAVVGPMAIPDAAIARIPGAGAMFGNDELAGLRTNMKLAQRASDVKAGLRKAPGGYPGVESASPTSEMPRTGTPGDFPPAEDLVGRDIAERAARGAVLTPEEEDILRQRVQQHFTDATGVESSARTAGRIYAGRGTQYRPTNEQLSLVPRPRIGQK